MEADPNQGSNAEGTTLGLTLPISQENSFTCGVLRGSCKQVPISKPSYDWQSHVAVVCWQEQGQESQEASVSPSLSFSFPFSFHSQFLALSTFSSFHSYQC